jgi:GTP-binding protein HflX
LLTDTVGFVRRLPHRLVEAFRATLEESVLSEFLIHVLDASQPEVLEFYETTVEVLSELGADQKHAILVFNKTDKVHDESVLSPLRARFPEAHFVSVHTGEGLGSLLEHMADLVSQTSRVCRLRIPLGMGAAIAKLHRAANVLDLVYEDEFACITASLPARLQADFSAYIAGD